MSVHFSNELVDKVRVAVVRYHDQDLYCYQKKITLKNGSQAINYFFLKQSPSQMSSYDLKPVELPYGTELEEKGSTVVVKKTHF